MRKLITFLACAALTFIAYLASGPEGVSLAVTILVTTTAAAAGATVSPLQGSQYEYLPWDALVEFAIYADTGDTWTISVFSGSDVLMQSSTAPILATATPIIHPDHFFLQDVAQAGERLGVQAVNGTGAVADFRTMVRITPL